MAKNYTFAEACAIINEGTNTEAIADIGRRYPVLLHKVSQVTAVVGDKFVDLMGFMPDYLTANKVNSAMKNTGSNSDETDDDAAGNDNDNDDSTSSTSETGGMPDYDSMSGKQLWDILGKAGKRKTAKSTKKADLVAACKAMHEAGGTNDAESESDSDDAEDDATSAGAYDGKTAMELFKECKKRGLKAAPKKPAKYYIDLLTKDDAEAAKGDDSEAEDEDWDDDSGKETSGKKAAAKTGGKTEKKSAKKTTSNEDAGDDEDWEI